MEPKSGADSSSASATADAAVEQAKAQELQDKEAAAIEKEREMIARLEAKRAKAKAAEAERERARVQEPQHEVSEIDINFQLQSELGISVVVQPSFEANSSFVVPSTVMIETTNDEADMNGESELILTESRIVADIVDKGNVVEKSSEDEVIDKKDVRRFIWRFEPQALLLQAGNQGMFTVR